MGKVLPQLAGKLDGMAARVPVPDSSVVDLVVKLNERPDADAVNKAIKDAAEGNMKGVLSTAMNQWYRAISSVTRTPQSLIAL